MEYGGGLSELRASSSEVLLAFRKEFRFKNPEWDSQKAVDSDADGYKYDTPEWIDFVILLKEEFYIPSGLFWAVRRWCGERGVQLDALGFPPWFQDSYKEKVSVPPDIVPGITLRDYQIQAVERALERRRGVLEIATGGGKTECGIGILFALQRVTGEFPATVWLVPDIQAGETALRRLEARGVASGLLGKQRRDLEVDVLVAVVNSAFNAVRRGDSEILDGWYKNCDVLLIDECHHQATAVTWQCVAAEIEAEYRIGLSGTPFKNVGVRSDPSILDPYDSWLVGFTGPTLLHLSPQDLIRQGHLSPGIFVSVLSAGADRNIWGMQMWQDVYRHGITQNTNRTAQVASLTANLCRMGRKPLVSIEKLEHGRDIQRVLVERYRVPAACSFGSGVLYLPRDVAEEEEVPYVPAPIYKWVTRKVKGKRKRVREQVGQEEDIVLVEAAMEVDKLLLRGIIGSIIGSRIFDEAVDIPWITDLVNAAGGKASQRLRQKIGRVLRTHQGKNAAWIWDFWDQCHPYLLSHSKKRWQIAVEEGYPTIDDWGWSSAMTTFDLARLNIGQVNVKLKEIEVKVAMTIPVPSEPGYTGIRPAIILRAALEEGDDVNRVSEQLHAQGLALFLQEAAKQAQWASYSANVTPQKAYEAYIAQFQSAEKRG